MPTASTPIRIDDEIDSAARSAAKRMSRSVAEQVSHWARLGRELERSPEVQALMRTQWADRIEQRLATLNLSKEFATRGQAHAELDPLGQVTEVSPAVVARPRRARQA